MILWCVILPIIAFIGIIIYGFYEEESIGLTIVTAILVAFLTFLIGSLLALFFGFIAADNEAETTILKEETIELAALKDNSTISGSFFLGSGSIEGKMKYYYLQRNEDNSLEMKNININSVRLYEYSTDEDNTPHITIKTYALKSDLLIFFCYWTETKTEIYIPKGTIQYNFSIDLE